MRFVLHLFVSIALFVTQSRSLALAATVEAPDLSTPEFIFSEQTLGQAIATMEFTSTADDRKFFLEQLAQPPVGGPAEGATTDLVVLPPSNPVVSVGTILGVPGIRDAVRATPAPVVGLSPIVGASHVHGMAAQVLTSIGVKTRWLPDSTVSILPNSSCCAAASVCPG